MINFQESVEGTVQNLMAPQEFVSIRGEVQSANERLAEHRGALRAPASKSDKTDDFKIGRWIGVVNDNGRFVSEKVGDGCQLSMRSFMR